MRTYQNRALGCLAGLAMLFGSCGAVKAAFVVVNNDEWTLSNTGFGNAPDAGVFAQNVASLFSGGGSGDFLAYSSNFGLTQNSLANTMTGAGHTWTVSTAVSFDLPTLQTYDGVFLAGPVGGGAPDTAVLTQYVQGGGNVYLAGGTGVFTGGATGEAAVWNPFLNSFGLAFGSPFNGVGGNIPIGSSHPIFANVDTLYQNNGSDALDIDVSDPRGEVLVSFNGHDLYAIFDSTNTSPIPEPSTLIIWSLLGGIGIGIGCWPRRRRRG